MHDSVDQSIGYGNDTSQDDELLCREASPEETASWLLDDGSVLRTVWTVYDRQFADGQREICVTKSTRIKQNGPLPLPKRVKRGESEKRAQNIEDSVKRAKQAVRLRCKAVGVDRILTLTYRENVTDRETVQKHFDLFRRRLNKMNRFQYVATLEKQERGAYHIHVAVKGRLFVPVIRNIWQQIVANGELEKKMGQINITNPAKYGFGKRGNHKIASYISKYVGKDVEETELNKKRYWSSKGIVVPEKNYWQLPYGTDTHDAFAFAMGLGAAHNGDGMQFFGNQALGVCWVATAPCG